MNNPVSIWDLVIFDDVSPQMIIDWFKEVAKGWVFQLERCPTTGTPHYQCRLSLKTRGRDFWWDNEDRFCPFEKRSFSRTSGDKNDRLTPAGNSFYVMKDESRVAGPWSDRDPYCPRQLREISKLYPWQKSVSDQLETWDTRVINLIIDEQGGRGKTTLALKLMSEKKAWFLPFMSSYKSLMEAVCDREEKGHRSGYLIDVPRAMVGERLNEFWAACEMIKGGYAFDTRYSFRDSLFDCPNIWVFINLKTVDWSMLSRDRWRVYRINRQMELVRHKMMKEVEEEI